jgi:hypothetical protein
MEKKFSEVKFFVVKLFEAIFFVVENFFEVVNSF